MKAFLYGLARKGGKPVVIATPDVPIHKQIEIFRSMQGLPNGEFSRVELIEWSLPSRYSDLPQPAAGVSELKADNAKGKK